MGDGVGFADGEADGAGVGWPAVYVGANVGSVVGLGVGSAVGLGVGSLALYVGTKVGSRVGLVVGIALGLGVGAENVRKLRNTAVSLRVAALLRVTVAPDRDTATATVPATMPVPLTTAPGWMTPVIGAMFLTTVLPIISVPVAVAKVA